MLPALNKELFSNCVTASTTASMLLPPPRRTSYPARAAAHTPFLVLSDLSFGIWPAPPWTTTTGNILAMRHSSQTNTEHWSPLGTRTPPPPNQLSNKRAHNEQCAAAPTQKYGRFIHQYQLWCLPEVKKAMKVLLFYWLLSRNKDCCATSGDNSGDKKTS